MILLLAIAAQLALVDQTRAATTSAAKNLPNYICQQTTARYNSTGTPLNWIRQDVVSAALVYENGKEDYRDITIDGKPQKGRKMIDIPGNTSTGEFATVLLDVLHASTGAVFKLRANIRTNPQDAAVYDFTVTPAKSHWSIMTSRGVITPGYRGSLWIDPATSRVKRLEWEAVALPSDFMLDSMQSSVDYDWVTLGAERFLLATHSEAVLCFRASPTCSRNVIDWRDYHLYQSESKLLFGDPPATKDPN